MEELDDQLPAAPRGCIWVAIFPVMLLSGVIWFLSTLGHLLYHWRTLHDLGWDAWWSSYKVTSGVWQLASFFGGLVFGLPWGIVNALLKREKQIELQQSFGVELDPPNNSKK